MEHFPIPGSEVAASVPGRPHIALARAWRLSAILDLHPYHPQLSMLRQHILRRRKALFVQLPDPLSLGPHTRVRWIQLACCRHLMRCGISDDALFDSSSSYRLR